jgi:RNA polymerase sigma-70 factor, ECF subfamily
VNTYRPAVFRLALSFLNDPAEADDAAQEAFVAALRALPSYRGDSAFTTWLYVITANVCRGRLRKRRVRERLAQTLRVLLHRGGVGAGQPEEQALRGEAQAAIARAVKALPEPQRLVVVLRYYHELRLAEIAAVLQVSERTVHNRLHAAHERLHTTLNGKVDER